MNNLQNYTPLVSPLVSPIAMSMLNTTNFEVDEIDGIGGKDEFLPHMLGHEGSGIVVEIGPKVKKVKPLNLSLFSD